MDTLGLVWGVLVTEADMPDREGAIHLLLTVRGLCTRLKRIWADGMYRGEFIEWVQRWCGWTVEVVLRSAYLEWLLTEVYPHQQLVLVLDNASFHHSAAIQAALSCFEQRVLVLWLPPYSPDLNPIERFWKHLKATACANHLYACLDQLLPTVRDFIDAHHSFVSDFHLSFSNNF